MVFRLVSRVLGTFEGLTLMPDLALFSSSFSSMSTILLATEAGSFGRVGLTNASFSSDSSAIAFKLFSRLFGTTEGLTLTLVSTLAAGAAYFFAGAASTFF